MRLKRSLPLCIASVLALAVGQAARAATTPSQTDVTTVTVSGATLFQSFFTGSSAPLSTNDFIDVDSNGFSTYHASGSASVQELAPAITNWNNGTQPSYAGPVNGLVVDTTQWNIVYRSVGSVNGLQELLNTGAKFTNPYSTTPVSAAAIAGIWVNGGSVFTGGAPTIPNTSTTGSSLPVALLDSGVNIAVMDVSSKWGLQAAGTPAWNNKPTQAGYGTNPVNSIPSANGSWNNLLVARTVSGGPTGPVTFNNNTQGAYNAQTLFDSPIAIAPISVVANPGAGVSQLKATDLQTLYVTGRLPTGENLAAETRSVGSGTGNGFANSLGVDPSFATGDNIGSEVGSPATGTDPTKLGSNYQPTNWAGTGDMVKGIRDTRLGIGYVGTDSAAGTGSNSGSANGYGLVKVAFNINNSTNNNYVAPSIDTLIHNNGTAGWLISGTETFVTIGDPNSTSWAGATNSGYAIAANPTMSSSQGALYIRNITESIKNYTTFSGTDATSQFMPGQYLGDNFLLTAVPDNVQNATDGTFFSANPNLNPTLQNYELTTNHGILANKFGAQLVSDAGAGKVPFRNNATASYSDGRTSGSYRYFDHSSTSITDVRVAGGFTVVETLNLRNKIAGDFNNTGVRNINQIPAMMAAVANPTQWAFDNRDPVNSGALATTSSPIPEILGDFNGDGNFNATDIRYFADGLAIQTSGPNAGHLDRKAGFAAVDLNSSGNYFGTTLKTHKPYANGDSRGDIAGSAAGPSAGAGPTGSDGAIDAKDIDYVISQVKGATGQPNGIVPATTGDSVGAYGTILTRATANANINVRADLSADMNGDLNINKDDLTDLITNVLGTQFGDINLDGKVNSSDLNLLLTNYGQAGGWAQGNFLGTATVDSGDLNLLLTNYNFDAGYPSSLGFGGIGVAPVPEPTSLAVLAAGSALALLRRKRR